MYYVLIFPLLHLSFIIHYTHSQLSGHKMYYSKRNIHRPSCKESRKSTKKWEIIQSHAWWHAIVASERPPTTNKTITRVVSVKLYYVKAFETIRLSLKISSKLSLLCFGVQVHQWWNTVVLGRMYCYNTVIILRKWGAKQAFLRSKAIVTRENLLLSFHGPSTYLLCKLRLWVPPNVKCTKMV